MAANPSEKSFDELFDEQVLDGSIDYIQQKFCQFYSLETPCALTKIDRTESGKVELHFRDFKGQSRISSVQFALGYIEGYEMMLKLNTGFGVH